MTGFIVSWIVMTITFVILTQLPTGIEADDFGKVGIAAFVFGLLNGLTSWFISSTILNVLTLGSSSSSATLFCSPLPRCLSPASDSAGASSAPFSAV